MNVIDTLTIQNKTDILIIYEHFSSFNYIHTYLAQTPEIGQGLGLF